HETFAAAWPAAMDHAPDQTVVALRWWPAAEPRAHVRPLPTHSDPLAEDPPSDLLQTAGQANCLLSETSCAGLHVAAPLRSTLVAARRCPVLPRNALPTRCCRWRRPVRVDR